MIEHLLTRGLRLRKVALSLLFVAAWLPSPANGHAVLMQESGPEPIIIQLKESLRLSDDLYQELTNLAELQNNEGMTVAKRWVGEKYLELLTFPQGCTEDQAQALMLKFQQWLSIEKAIPVSAYNLEFNEGDFAREFGPADAIPEAALRGLDNDYATMDRVPPADEQLATPHDPTQLIVRWKDEYVWNGEETGFGATMADFNALTGTTVVSDLYSSAYELTQVLAIDPARTSLAEELQRYNDCP